MVNVPGAYGRGKSVRIRTPLYIIPGTWYYIADVRTYTSVSTGEILGV